MLLNSAAPARTRVDDGIVSRRRVRLVLSVCCTGLACVFLVGCASVGSSKTSAGTATLIERPASSGLVLYPGASADGGVARVSSQPNAAKRASREPDSDDLDNQPESAVFAEAAPRISLSSLLGDSALEAPVVDHAIFNVARQELLPPERNEEKKTQRPEPLPDETAPLRVTIPSEIPGAAAPPIDLPDMSDEHRAERQSAINLLFPPSSRVVPLPKSSEHPMTLEELEELAIQNSPFIVQASADITMSQGGAIQSGVYPNPVIGYESDTVGSSFTRDYQGMFMTQVVKTGGKLGLQRAVANMDLMNTQLAFARTQQEVRRQVRAGYYNVLVAQEANRINEALLRFLNEVYDVMVERMKDIQAPYETAQLRSLVSQARMALNQSQNRYQSAWKQLATATGVPQLRPAPLVDRVDMAVPNLDFDALLNRTLNVHPDIEASRNFEAQSKLNLRLQRAIPIPDVTVSGVFQNDFTTPGFNRTSYNLNVSVPVPIFDRNLGNIRTAEGKVQRSAEQLAVTRNQLTNQLADAFERYQTARVQSEFYRTQVLPDLFRAYRGVYDAHILGSNNVAFGDIIVAQQNLAVGISAYINSLQQQWMAATDIANVTQLGTFKELFTLPTGQPAPRADEIPQPQPMEGTRP